MAILFGVLIYIAIVVAFLGFFRFVHRCDDVMRQLHTDLPEEGPALGTSIAHNRVA